MGLFTELPETLREVDVIVVGGGSAGCIVAARLADADPNLEVLLIERGPNNEMPTVEIPALFASHLAPDSKTAYFAISKPSPVVGNRPLMVPSASVLGGGSSINFLMYSRAQRGDFDAWKTPGWSSHELMYYAKKSETYHSQYVRGSDGYVHISRKISGELLQEAQLSERADMLTEKYGVTSNIHDEADVHGRNGPIHVSPGTYSSPRMQNEYIAAATKIGWREHPDTLDANSINAVWRSQLFVSPDGKRQDTASCYIHPRLRDGKHPNLHVLVETQVARVLFDKKNERAVGVEFRPNPLFHADAASKPLQGVKARKLVVLSCGSSATPLLLERSGVGEAKVLERAGVPVVVELPGVGNDYEDHHLMGYAYKSAFSADETADALMAGKVDMGDLIKNKSKMLGWNAQQAQSKARPSESEVDGLGPEFRKAWDSEFKDHPEKPLAVMNLVAGWPDPAHLNGEPHIGVTVFTTYPFSRGSIHITGATLDSDIDFDSGFFAGEHGPLDLKKHMWVYKKQREIIRRMPSYRGEQPASHPPFDANSPAACVNLTEPLPADVQNIVYSADDDAILEKWIRANVATTWHSIGTCKMQAREKKGVVDANLGVYGIRGLKIADLSIAPGNLAGNTNASALMIGEKAADIFLKELGLAPV